MVMVIRTPSWARKHFTANDLAGWPNGVRFEVRGRARKRIRYMQQTQTKTAKVVAVQIQFTFE